MGFFRELKKRTGLARTARELLVRDHVDPAGNQVTIKMADGLYDGAFFEFGVPGPSVIIQGNTTTPSNTIVKGTMTAGVIIPNDATVTLDSFPSSGEGIAAVKVPRIVNLSSI